MAHAHHNPTAGKYSIRAAARAARAQWPSGLRGRRVVAWPSSHSMKREKGELMES